MFPFGIQTDIMNRVLGSVIASLLVLTIALKIIG